MSLFWNDLFQHSFLQYAIIGGILASIACGTMGSIIVVRRTSYIAGAIAHSVMGGMGAAYYLQRVHGISWLSPLTGATISAIVTALAVAWITSSEKQREDTILSAIWAIGMSVGISFMAITPGYHENLMSYLFGNILMINSSDLIHMAILDAVIIGLLFLLYNRFLVISFQPELARLKGLRVNTYHTLLLLMSSLTVVLLTQVVGLVMVIALLTLPASTALQLTSRLWKAMVLAFLLCLVCIVTGIAVSYEPDLPAGATVIQITAFVYLFVLAAKHMKRRFMPHHNNPNQNNGSNIE